MIGFLRLCRAFGSDGTFIAKLTDFVHHQKLSKMLFRIQNGEALEETLLATHFKAWCTSPCIYYFQVVEK